MTRALIPILFLFAACGQSSSGKKESKADTIKSDSITVIDSGDTIHVDTPNIPWTGAVNDQLKKLSAGKWRVVSDAESGWAKDVFDYFVAPERKKDPDFPYITKGDYDCDGKPDVAALVTDATHKVFKLVFILDDGKKIELWKEDVQGAAIKNLTKSEVTGFEELEKEKKVQLKCDGVDVAWFETSSYVVYWNGRKFENIWTGD